MENKKWSQGIYDKSGKAEEKQEEEAIKPYEEANPKLDKEGSRQRNYQEKQQEYIQINRNKKII